MRKKSTALYFAFAAGIFFCLTFLAAFSVPDAGGMPAETHEIPEPAFYLPVIMYHSTFNKHPGKFNVTPAQLEADLIYLKENGFTAITVSDLTVFQKTGKKLPKKPIMLTFDDGYTNNYLYAFPLFKKYKMKCVISVIGHLIEKNYDESGEKKSTLAHLDYEQIREMQESGLVEIQNHTYNMHGSSKKRRVGLRKMKKESADEYERSLSEDLMLLDKKLYERSGVRCTAVAYPYGAYSKETVPILKKIGYVASFNCREGINKITRTGSLFELKRFNRPSGKSSAEYFKRVEKLTEKQKKENEKG